MARTKQTVGPASSAHYGRQPASTVGRRSTFKVARSVVPAPSQNHTGLLRSLGGKARRPVSMTTQRTALSRQTTIPVEDLPVQPQKTPSAPIAVRRPVRKAREAASVAIKAIATDGFQKLVARVPTKQIVAGSTGRKRPKLSHAKSSVVDAVAKMDTSQLFTAAKLKRVTTADNVDTKRAKKEGGGKSKARKKVAKTSTEKSTKKGGRISKKESNDNLTPRPKLKIFNLDPTFELKEDVPFVSVQAYNKLAIRAVLTKNAQLLDRLKKDTAHISTLQERRSVFVNRDALTYAVLAEDEGMIKTLYDDLEKPVPKRVQPVKSFLDVQRTGNDNFHMLGRRTRPVQMTRGGREGNNAFTKDLESPWRQRNITHELIKLALQNDVNVKIVQLLVSISNQTLRTAVYEQIFEAVRYGHRKLAGRLMELYGGSSFNELHKEVLLKDQGNLKAFRSVSVKKKGVDNKDVMPIHCACINPNAKFLQELIDVEPDFNPPDKDNLRSVHYAAACTGTAPLQLLIAKNASIYDVDKQGNTPLHIACKACRAHNIDILVAEYKKRDPELAVLNRKNRQSLAPLHIAAMRGHLDTVNALLAHGALIDVETGAGLQKITPLVLACQHGHMDVVKRLIDAQATVDKRDKLKRTALTHAIISGMAHITGYLLKIGANPDIRDSSGNTPTHYAAAYGWWFCLKLLIEVGADLCVANDWKLTPLAVAYLKGHMGLADLLLKQPGMDLNCQDDNGMTLVSLTLNGEVSESMTEQLKYLIIEKKADCKLKDSQGNGPLHHLAICQLPTNSQNPKSFFEDAEKAMLAIAAMLVAAGAATNDANEASQTPFMLAVTSRNARLAQYLMEQNKPNGSIVVEDVEVSDESNQSPPVDDNVLHGLVQLALSYDYVDQIFANLLKIQPNEVDKLLARTNSGGNTPFLQLCQEFLNMHKETTEECTTKLTNLGNLMVAMLARKTIIYQQMKKINNQASLKDDEDDEEENSDEEEENSNTEKDAHEAAESKQELALGQSCLHILAPCGDISVSGRNGQYSPFRMLLDTNAALLNRPSVGEDDAIMKCRTTNALELRDADGRTPLFMAIEKRHAKAALLLIAAGADVNMKCAVGDKPSTGNQIQHPLRHSELQKEKLKHETPLMVAIRNELTDVVTALLKAGAKIDAVDSNLNQPLHHAVCNTKSHTMPSIVQALIDGGANVNAQNTKQRTPLHLAANADDASADVTTEIAELLIARGADPFALDHLQRVPLHYAFVKIGNHKNVSEKDPIALCNVLIKAMSARDSRWVERRPLRDQFGQTPVHLAAKRGANICCISLLKHSVLCDLKDAQGNTPLALAVYHGHMTCALTLLQADAADMLTGMNVYSDKYENEEEYWKVNKWRWAPKRDIVPQTRQVPIPSLVVKAEWQGMIYIILDLLEKQGGSLLSLIRAALEHRKYNLAFTLIRVARSRGIKLEDSKNEMEEPLMHCLAQHAEPNVDELLQVKVAECLRDAGVNLHRVLPKWQHPAVKAAQNQNIKFFSIYTRPDGSYSFGTEIAEAAFAMFVWDPVAAESRISAIKKGEESSDILLKLLGVSPQSVDKIFSYRACMDLCDASPSVNKVGPVYMVTPLIHAINYRCFHLAKFLIVHANASINAADSDGMTPFMHAARSNNIDMLKLLAKPTYEQTASDTVDSDEEDDNMNKGRVFMIGDDLPVPKSQISNSQATYENISDDGANAEQETINESLHNGINGHPDEPNEASDQQSDEEVDDDEKPKASRRKLIGRKRKAPRKQLVARSKKAKTAGSEKHEPFQATSKITLNAVDSRGYSVLHHAVLHESAYGAYDNEELVRLLAEIGFPMNVVDHRGKKAIVYAQENSLVKVVALLHTLTQDAVPTDGSARTRQAVDDGAPVSEKLRCLDVDGDAQRFMQKQMASRKQPSATERLKPHQLSGCRVSGELVLDDDTKQVFSVLLVKCDLNFSIYGFYNFYRLQLIRRKGSEVFIVFTNWGRVGDEGQYQKTPFATRETAMKEFKSIFRQKTGNEWSCMPDNFENKKGKYRLVHLEENSSEGRGPQLQIVLDSSVKSNLPDHLQKLIADLSDVKAMQSNSRLILGGSYSHMGPNETMPLGTLTREQLLKAREILEELALTFNDLQKKRDNKHAAKFDVDAFEHITYRLADLSNEFYCCFPLGNFGQLKLPILNDHNLIMEYMAALDNLIDVEFATKLLSAASESRAKINPLDYIYAALGVQMHQLSPDDPESQAILHYIYNSEPDRKVRSIYTVCSNELENRFLPQANKLGNRYLLWHGTSAVNLLSILKLGLLPAPPQAVHTGHLFGKGVYTADVFAKSSNYCRSSAGGYNYVLLCEVALGKSDIKPNLWGLPSVDPVEKGSHSLKALGQEAPDVAQNLTTPTGSIIPLGKLSQQKPPKEMHWLSLPYNEYIVHDPAQILVRYIVEF